MIINEEGLIIIGIICSFFSFIIGIFVGGAMGTGHSIRENKRLEDENLRLRSALEYHKSKEVRKDE